MNGLISWPNKCVLGGSSFVDLSGARNVLRAKPVEDKSLLISMSVADTRLAQRYGPKFESQIGRLSADAEWRVRVIMSYGIVNIEGL
jgi:hypothetical protein